MDDESDDDDETHPPRILVRVGMVFYRGQKLVKVSTLAKRQLHEKA